MRVLLFLCTLLLGSCATHEQGKSLYSTFLDYESNTSKSNIIQSSPSFFSKNLLNQLNLNSLEVAEQLLFKGYMAKKINNFEMILGTSGCLTINGFDSENMPISFNLKYIKSEQRWLIDEINVFFASDEADFSQTAKCPSEYNN
ncbi:hypothetical protein NBRC116592_03280 [Colwellia sp. KU-HH00111]|uniref:hypothetical protein n=1 Tax=Colwellia sp. KU-HH00111 TaxID=3127652 RepID=UPI0031060C63